MANTTQYDAIIVGSGFGGSMSAYVLVHAGWRVLMLERGDWVRRGPQNRAPESSLFLSSAYSYESPYAVRGGQRGRTGAICAVGGASAFYGGVSFRLREHDFFGAPGGVGWPAARWPFAYDELEPYYGLAEAILGVAGATAADPTDPPRSTPLRPAPSLARPSRMIRDAATRLGLHPFQLPLAINFEREDGRARCARCSTCDCYACAISAKNDLSTVVIPKLIGRGLEVRPNAVVVRLVVKAHRITAVHCVDRMTGKPFEVSAREVIVAAGALASPHLILASGLEQFSPGGWTVGRYLMRHCNAIVYGLFPESPDPEREFHKQIGIHDFYDGHPAIPEPAGKLGIIQQIHAPPLGMVRQRVPWPFRHLAERVSGHLTGLIVIAEDQPSPQNRVWLDGRRLDRFGMPGARVDHRYSRRDLAARRVLAARAAEVLQLAGAALTYRFPIATFSHALGTVRMGTNPRMSALDPFGAFRGIDNLCVADGSSFPTAGAVNPSLTIAATALRAAEHLAGTSAWRQSVHQRTARANQRLVLMRHAASAHGLEVEHV